MSRFYDLEGHLRDEEGNTIRRPLEILVRQDEHHIRGKRLGRHLEHDPMSKLYPVEGVSDILDSAIIESVYYERLCEPFDQGELGACTGMAMAGLLMSQPVAGLTAMTERDAIELYAEATKLDRIPGEYPPDDTGSSGLAVAKAAKNLGLIRAYRHAFSMRAALKALQSGPVLTGFGWYDSFDSPDEDGLISVKPGAVVRGGHEVYASSLKIEHNEDGTIDERNSMIGMWNSWGRDFGVSGQFKMSIATWRYLMKEYGDITVPVLLTPEG